VEAEEPDEKMVLSSVHQAKGLEWRAVFVVWLADGRFPSIQALRDPDGEEEERRLFYVACTRARDDLTLCYPLVTAPRDRERVVLKASRFLEELPGEPAVYERWQLEEGAVSPALAPAPGSLPLMTVPALFGPAGGAKEPEEDDDGDGGDGNGEGGDVPF
jgi:DNA helicase-2/ATP-dependent DNA helicase PcrA